MEQSRSVYICDRCSKEFRNWQRGEGAEVISPTPICTRCTSICRIKELHAVPTTPLEDLVQKVISKAAIQSRLFRPAKPKNENGASCALLSTGAEQEVLDPDSPVVGEN